MLDVEKLRDTIPTPIWASWKNKRTVTLNQALLLCMNVCPRWYEARDDKDKFLSNITIWSLYRLYLEDAHDWASGSGWVIEYLAEADIQEDDFVDLKKFARWACQDVEWNGIPAEFKAIAKVGDVAPIEGKQKPTKSNKEILKPNDWNPIAEQYAIEFLKDDPKRTLTKVADMIFNKFIDEGITGISGDLKASTIKRHLSDWGFNLKQLGIKKAIKK
jgi:hypothetical protein